MLKDKTSDYTNHLWHANSPSNYCFASGRIVAFSWHSTTMPSNRDVLMWKKQKGKKQHDFSCYCDTNHRASGIFAIPCSLCWHLGCALCQTDVFLFHTPLEGLQDLFTLRFIVNFFGFSASALISWSQEATGGEIRGILLSPALRCGWAGKPLSREAPMPSPNAFPPLEGLR